MSKSQRQMVPIPGHHCRGIGSPTVLPLVICQSQGDAVPQFFGRDVIFQIEGDRPGSLILEGSWVFTTECRYQVGCALEVDGVVILFLFPTDPERASALGFRCKIAGLTPFECFLKRSNAVSLRSSLEYEIPKK